MSETSNESLPVNTAEEILGSLERTSIGRVLAEVFISHTDPASQRVVEEAVPFCDRPGLVADVVGAHLAMMVTFDKRLNSPVLAVRSYPEDHCGGRDLATFTVTECRCGDPVQLEIYEPLGFPSQESAFILQLGDEVNGSLKDIQV